MFDFRVSFKFVLFIYFVIFAVCRIGINYEESESDNKQQRYQHFDLL